MTGPIVMTLLVRNEEDIIEANIEFHLAQGADFIIATDNRSTDRTRDLLLRYAQDPADGQRLKMAIEVLLAARSDDSKP